MSPRPRLRRSPHEFRSPEEIREDRTYRTCRWRCRAHGYTEEPIILGATPYCPADDCTLPVVAAWGLPTSSATEWNAGGLPPKPRAERTGTVKAATLEHLERNPGAHRTGEIVAAVAAKRPATYGAVSQALQLLRARGRVVSPSVGWWQAPAPRETPGDPT